MPHTPEQPEPADPREAVEARLCAYLEGDLTGDEQADIERHLASSPPHRKLLTDLASVRGWTRQLPREPAPADLAEQFQQQVERALLLGPAGPRPAGRRWLVAAVLLLTAGGAAVVSTVLLRRPAGRPSVAAQMSAARDETTTAPTPVDGPLGGEPLAMPPDLAPVGTANAVAPATVGPTDGVADVVALAGVRPTDSVRVVALVVAAPAPAAAVDRAFGYLKANRLAWEGPAGRELNSVVGGATANADRNARLKSGQNDGSVANRTGNLYANTVVQTQNVAPLQGRLANTANVAEPPAGSPPPAAPSQAKADAGKPADDVVFVVRDLTPAQVRDLSAALSAGGATVQSVDVPRLLSVGEQLDVTIPQLAGPGVDRTTVVRVASDGTVALPMLTDPVQAAGGTAADLERRVATRYRTANLIPAATVTVAAHGGRVTTLPADRVTVVLSVRVSQPTTRGAAAR